MTFPFPAPESEMLMKAKFTRDFSIVYGMNVLYRYHEVRFLLATMIERKKGQEVGMVWHRFEPSDIMTPYASYIMIESMLGE